MQSLGDTTQRMSARMQGGAAASIVPSSASEASDESPEVKLETIPAAMSCSGSCCVAVPSSFYNSSGQRVAAKTQSMASYQLTVGDYVAPALSQLPRHEHVP